MDHDEVLSIRDAAKAAAETWAYNLETTIMDKGYSEKLAAAFKADFISQFEPDLANDTLVNSADDVCKQYDQSDVVFEDQGSDLEIVGGHMILTVKNFGWKIVDQPGQTPVDSPKADIQLTVAIETTEDGEVLPASSV